MILTKSIVCSLEYAEKLKLLGYSQSSVFAWVRPYEQKKHVLAFCIAFDGIIIEDELIGTDFRLGNDEYRAYTAEELINIMRKYIEDDKGNRYYLTIVKNDWHGYHDSFYASYKRYKKELHAASDDTLVNALASLIIKMKKSNPFY